jgi:hypothetical protein
MLPKWVRRYVKHVSILVCFFVDEQHETGKYVIALNFLGAL